ncbi:MAG: hypothetical protein V1836_02630 [Candidatus Aenigmatarchaeota archaeon]
MIDLAEYEKRWLARANKLSKDSFHVTHFDKSTMHGAIAEISDNMRAYADDWNRNAVHLRAAGVYKRVAEFIKPTECYLDVCCGSGELLAEVNFDNSLGIDINHYSLAKAEQYLLSMNKPVNSYASSIVKWVEGKGAVVTPIDNDSWKLLERGKFNLLQDDVRTAKKQRSLELTRRHIKEIGRPDCISFMLPGGSCHMAGEIYYSERGIHDIGVASLYEIAEIASQLLPRNGHYVEALRFVRQPGMEKGLRSDFERMYGGIFAIERMEFLEMPEELTDYQFYLVAAGNPQLNTKNSAVGKSVVLSIMSARRR